MFSLIWRTIKDRQSSIIIYLIASVGFVILYISIYPTIQNQSQQLEQLLKVYPESIMKAFNIDIKSYITIGGYLAAEHFSFIWPIMLFTYITSFAGAALSGEIEKGTIELLLSQPISRVKLFLSKYLSGFMLLLLFTVISILSIPLILKAYNIGFEIKNFLSLFVLSTLLGWAVYSMGIFFSAIFSEKGKVFFSIGGLLVLMFVLNVVSSLKSNFVDLKYFSFFYYYNATNVLVYNKVDHLAYWIFAGVIVFFAIIGLVFFSKRDISV